jgi:hypothetical protein
LIRYSADISDWNLPAFAVRDCDAKDALAQEKSFRVIPKSATTKIRQKGFRLIKPAVDC